MLLPRLIEMIESHADELTEQVLKDIAANPRLRALRDREDEVLRKKVHEVYHDLGRWLHAHDEAQLEAVFGEFGRRRRVDGTGLDELVYAVLMVKNHLWSFIERNDVTDQPLELAQEMHLIRDIGRFFDRALYHIVRGYEHAPPAEQVAGAAAAAARHTR
jgi:hypothetical protein